MKASMKTIFISANEKRKKLNQHKAPKNNHCSMHCSPLRIFLFASNCVKSIWLSKNTRKYGLEEPLYLHTFTQWNVTCSHFLKIPLLYFKEKPVICFAAQKQLLVSIWNATRGWNGLNKYLFFCTVNNIVKLTGLFDRYFFLYAISKNYRCFLQNKCLFISFSDKSFLTWFTTSPLTF